MDAPAERLEKCRGSREIEKGIDIVSYVGEVLGQWESCSWRHFNRSVALSEVSISKYYGGRLNFVALRSSRGALKADVSTFKCHLMKKSPRPLRCAREAPRIRQQHMAVQEPRSTDLQLATTSITVLLGGS